MRLNCSAFLQSTAAVRRNTTCLPRMHCKQVLALSSVKTAEGYTRTYA